MRGRVIVVVCLCVRVCVTVCLSVNSFSREPCLLWVPNVEVWTSTMGALYSKKLERRWQQKGVFRRLAYSMGCALIRDRDCMLTAAL